MSEEPQEEVNREFVAGSPVLQWVATGKTTTCAGHEQRVLRRLAELYARNAYSFEQRLWSAVGPSNQTPYGKIGLEPMESLELANLFGYFTGVCAGAGEDVAVVARQMLLLLNGEFKEAVSRKQRSRILLPLGVLARIVAEQGLSTAPRLDLERAGGQDEAGDGSGGEAPVA